MTLLDADTPASRQLEWVLVSLFRGDDMDEQTLRARFNEAFLTAVPIETVRAVATRMVAEGALTVDRFRGTDFQAMVEVHTPAGDQRRVSITVDADEPHQIAGLNIAPIALEVDVANTVVLLNGTSSSGKTTLAKALLQMLPGGWLHVSVDTFLEMTSNREGSFFPIVRGFHGSIGALAAAGNRLVVDHVLEQREWLVEIADALGETPVVLVGVHCPVDVLDQRERERGDRGIGTARAQIGMVHRHARYDFEVDTSATGVEAAAATIAERAVAGPPVGSLRSHLT